MHHSFYFTCYCQLCARNKYPQEIGHICTISDMHITGCVYISIYWKLCPVQSGAYTRDKRRLLQAEFGLAKNQTEAKVYCQIIHNCNNYTNLKTVGRSKMDKLSYLGPEGLAGVPNGSLLKFVRFFLSQHDKITRMKYFWAEYDWLPFMCGVSRNVPWDTIPGEALSKFNIHVETCF